MFEYGPNGERRLSKFGQRVVILLVVVAMVLVTTAYLVAHRQNGENAGAIITGGFALAGTLGMGVLTWGQGRRNEDILHHQNEQLEEIKGRVTSKDVEVARAVEVVRESYQTAIGVIMEEVEREKRTRHKLEGQNGVLNAVLKDAEGKLAEARELNAKLMAQSDKGEAGPKGEKGDKGDPGDLNG